MYVEKRTRLPISDRYLIFLYNTTAVYTNMRELLEKNENIKEVDKHAFKERQQQI